MQHAPRVLAALGQTGLISLHSADTLYGALLSEPCVSCREYGAFLFLPTCERCCYECLCRNQSLWVISTTHARKCFDLTSAQAKQLPSMRSIPGRYFVGHQISRRRQMKLTSVRAAKELGIVIHGSVENMAEALAAKRTRLTIKEYHIFRHLQDAPLRPPLRDLSRLPSEQNVPNDDYCSMASILFPSLSRDNPLESGLWCRGYDEAFENYRWGQLAPVVISHLACNGNVFRVLLGTQRRAWSTAGFLEHVTHCYGVRKLDSSLERIEKMDRLRREAPLPQEKCCPEPLPRVV
jgi:hypothetical protein